MNESKEIPVKKTKNKFEIDAEKYRAQIDDSEKIKKLADKINTSPQRVVNWFVDLCVDECSNLVDEMETIAKNKLRDLIKTKRGK